MHLPIPQAAPAPCATAALCIRGSSSTSIGHFGWDRAGRVTRSYGYSDDSTSKRHYTSVGFLIKSGNILEPRACHRRPAGGLSVQREYLRLDDPNMAYVAVVVWGSPAGESTDGKRKKRDYPIERCFAPSSLDSTLGLILRVAWKAQEAYGAMNVTIHSPEQKFAMEVWYVGVS